MLQIVYKRSEQIWALYHLESMQHHFLIFATVELTNMAVCPICVI